MPPPLPLPSSQHTHNQQHLPPQNKSSVRVPGRSSPLPVCGMRNACRARPETRCVRLRLARPSALTASGDLFALRTCCRGSWHRFLFRLLLVSRSSLLPVVSHPLYDSRDAGSFSSSAPVSSLVRVPGLPSSPSDLTSVALARFRLLLLSRSFFLFPGLVCYPSPHWPLLAQGYANSRSAAARTRLECPQVPCIERVLPLDQEVESSIHRPRGHSPIRHLGSTSNLLVLWAGRGASQPSNSTQ